MNDVIRDVALSEVSSEEVPLELLLEADPSQASIKSYLDGSWCFVATYQGKVVGACVVNCLDQSKKDSSHTAEVFNVSVLSEYQQHGVGSALLKFCLIELAEKQIGRVELGTGSFGYQLTYYQRLGFRVESVIKDYFLDNYSEPIFENGIQHKDMLRLYIDLNPNY